MNEPSRWNKYTSAVLDELEPWLHQHGASYRYAAADPPTVAWDLPRYGTARNRCWRITFGCNPHELDSWRVLLAERDHRGTVYDTAETTAPRGQLHQAAATLITQGLERVSEPTARCGHAPSRGGPSAWLLDRLARPGRAQR